MVHMTLQDPMGEVSNTTSMRGNVSEQPLVCIAVKHCDGLPCQHWPRLLTFYCPAQSTQFAPSRPTMSYKKHALRCVRPHPPYASLGCTAFGLAIAMAASPQCSAQNVLSYPDLFRIHSCKTKRWSLD
eukprot:2975804-Amphidinium_carterae.1